ncbi:MAG: hypothetical protein Edafosvirus1_17 [Edafosvirus sp.]|uniref:Uncharacterized protein n=1 Tax=Edafosvirus sp. TaxID=2487765 RepID=A0A3G4ZRZ0_9VIRU|nr:MAG: hypothetical protein Edafosvirus1_17 [Edafosvirus sp.]
MATVLTRSGQEEMLGRFFNQETMDDQFYYLKNVLQQGDINGHGKNIIYHISGCPTDPLPSSENIVDLPPRKKYWWFYIVFLCVILMISVPYAYWESLVPDLKTNSVYLLIFMTIINCEPFLSWIVYHWKVVGGKQKLMEKRCDLLSQIPGEPNIDDEKGERKMLEVASLTPPDSQMLNGFLEELQVAINYGKIELENQKQQNIKTWNSYMHYASVWWCLLQSLYAVWIISAVFDSNAESSGKAIFTILLITSPIRFSIPIFITFRFLYDCNLAIEKIFKWRQLHHGKVNVAHVCNLLRHNVQTRKQMEDWWQLVFLTMFCLPLICMILVFLATIENGSIVKNQWFFLVYCMHYSGLAFVAFRKACQVGHVSKQQRVLLLSDVATGNCEYVNSTDTQIKSYKEYIKLCYPGFEIFGLAISDELLVGLSVTLASLIGWLADHVLRN